MFIQEKCLANFKSPKKCTSRVRYIKNAVKRYFGNSYAIWTAHTYDSMNVLFIRSGCISCLFCCRLLLARLIAVSRPRVICSAVLFIRSIVLHRHLYRGRYLTRLKRNAPQTRFCSPSAGIEGVLALAGQKDKHQSKGWFNLLVAVCIIRSCCARQQLKDTLHTYALVKTVA